MKQARRITIEPIERSYRRPFLLRVCAPPREPVLLFDQARRFTSASRVMRSMRVQLVSAIATRISAYTSCSMWVTPASPAAASA